MLSSALYSTTDGSFYETFYPVKLTAKSVIGLYVKNTKFYGRKVLCMFIF